MITHTRPSSLLVLSRSTPCDSETCTTVYVTGPAAGVYLQDGDYGSRGDFFAGNGAYNMYWTFYAGKPVNRNRFRRGLALPDRGGGAVRWSEGYGESNFCDVLVQMAMLPFWCVLMDRCCCQEELRGVRFVGVACFVLCRLPSGDKVA